MRAGRWSCGLMATVLVCVALTGCAPVPTKLADDCANSDTASEASWHTLAPGVHVWQPAVDQEPHVGNVGHVSPTTVLVHQQQAWVIDPGPNLRQGQRLVAHVRCVWGARIERVINTHAHADNVLANSAFAQAQRDDRVSVWATARTAVTMAQRCPACLDDLTERVGEHTMAGTQIVLPDVHLRPGEVLQLGPHRLQVREARNAHTQSDLVLWDEAHRIAWVGGLVYGQRLPELAQGSLLGWRQALADLQALQPRWVVGATLAGPSGAGASAQDALAATDAYLAHVQQVVLRGMEDGLQVSELPLQAAAPFDGWAGQARHGFNLQRAWRELEPAWMDGLLRP
jgi:glyoxylase-like metal-dependent hydrolase (beta-lactamase superfamily II)